MLGGGSRVERECNRLYGAQLSVSQSVSLKVESIRLIEVDKPKKRIKDHNIQTTITLKLFSGQK